MRKDKKQKQFPPQSLRRLRSLRQQLFLSVGVKTELKAGR
jgi:hypothetical protein